MVPYLKEKNIKFEIMPELEAEKYLRYNNNYYNVTAYKHNFDIKHMNYEQLHFLILQFLLE